MDQSCVETARERDRLKASNAELVEVLAMLLFSAVTKEHGIQVAHALEQNNWAWSDDAPRFISPIHEQARVALSNAKATTETDHD